MGKHNVAPASFLQHALMSECSYEINLKERGRFTKIYTCTIYNIARVLRIAPHGPRFPRRLFDKQRRQRVNGKGTLRPLRRDAAHVQRRSVYPSFSLSMRYGPLRASKATRGAETQHERSCALFRWCRLSRSRRDACSGWPLHLLLATSSRLPAIPERSHAARHSDESVALR